MNKQQSAIRLTKVLPHVTLTILLAGCSANTAQYFSSSSMKMAHHTTILNHKTHRLSDNTSQNSSTVNFEYEEIITQ